MKDEILEEIEPKSTWIQKYFGISVKIFALLVVLVIGVGVYLGILLFGDNSLEVLLQLEEYESYLQREVKELKQENAVLQKEYFELLELDPNKK